MLLPQNAICKVPEGLVGLVPSCSEMVPVRSETPVECAPVDFRFNKVRS